MLSSLTLKNFALVKSEEIEFTGGFNCLLGQSGAGKSVIIDALSFLLGGKSGKEMIRSGESQLRVDGVFDNLPDAVTSALSTLEIEVESDEIVISRTLNAEGKTSSRINGVPVTAKILQSVAENLAEFCGQQESVGLLNSSNHLAFLDLYAGKPVEKQKALVQDLSVKLRQIKEKIDSLGGDEEKRAREIELLRFQHDEIISANLSAEEEKSLEQRLDFISNAEKIYEKTSEAIALLNSERENVVSKLYDAKNSLSSVSDFDEISELKDRIESAYYEVKDIASTLEDVRDSAEFNPRELEEIDARMDEIKMLKRKYGRTVEDVLAFADEAGARLEELENNDQLLKDLQEQEASISKNLTENCEILSDMRKASAVEFEKEICRELEELEMKGTRFVVHFERGACSANGFDNVTFLFSANVGQDVRPLNKIASGGELSRLLLAFKNVMRSQSSQTVVFDEIDAGISGRTAGVLAEKLKKISKYNQIICITHTPVVASKAENFLLVEKKVEDGDTFSCVHTLDENGTILQLARLIDDSEQVSKTAIDHAKKLLKEK